MRKTTIEIFDDISELHSDKERKAAWLAVQQIPAYPVQLVIDCINSELKRLHMPYLIEDILASSEVLPQWIVKDDENPTKLNFKEPMYPVQRSRRLYELMLTPFKEALVFYPKTLEQAADLFNIDLSDNWELGSFRNWLLMINKAAFPHECKIIMEKLMKMSVHNGD